MSVPRNTPSVPLKKVANGDIWFFTERYWNQGCCHGNNIVGVILFLMSCTFLVPSLKITTLIFLEILFIQYFIVLVERSMTIKYWIKNIIRNIGAVIFKLGTRNVHHLRNKMTPTILLPWQHSWFQSLSVKNQISPFATFLSGTGGLPLPIRLLGVDDPCVRWNLGILVVIKTGPAA